MSLPSWERGLKFALWSEYRIDIAVAPLVGARIEIVNLQHASCERKSLPSWERGLKFIPAQLP